MGIFSISMSPPTLVLEQVREVNGMGMEVCCTLGMLNGEQAKQLKEAGLTAYNHNLDTSREFYPSVITTRQVVRTLGDRTQSSLPLSCRVKTKCC